MLHHAVFLYIGPLLDLFHVDISSPKVQDIFFLGLCPLDVDYGV